MDQLMLYGSQSSNTEVHRIQSSNCFTIPPCKEECFLIVSYVVLSPFVCDSVYIIGRHCHDPAGKGYKGYWQTLSSVGGALIQYVNRKVLNLSPIHCGHPQICYIGNLAPTK